MIRAVLIDLSGTLHIESTAIGGAVEALKKLRQTNVLVRFVTNTTKESKRILYERLTSLGFVLEKSEIFSSLSAAKALIEAKSLRPMLMVSEEAMEDFEDVKLRIGDEKANAVVIGLAPEEFHYERLNEAFRLLLDGAELIGIHAGKYYRRGDGLALGPGCFIRGLEYSAKCKAHIVGKPTKNFFLSALDGIEPSQAVMIGDDATDDVEGAMAAGLRAILVKTGKYRDGDEARIQPGPSLVCADFPQAVDSIIDELEKQC